MTAPWESRHVLGVRVDAATYESATQQILAWAAEPRGRTVCCATVHMVMECFDHPDLMRIVNGADLVTADGVPLVWTLRALGVKRAARVYGPDLTRILLTAAEDAGIAVGFYGGCPGTLERLIEAVSRAHPRLAVAYAWAPPFRPLTAAEEDTVITALRASGVRVLFVGLGCPKQEQWAAAHSKQSGVVMVCVGAAFDFLAGVKPEAPAFVQRAGCEWLFRLAVEPRRLCMRYLKTNPRFLLHCGSQLVRAHLGGTR